MPTHQAKTTLRKQRRAEDPMREFDRLPPELRAWLAGAVLPWRPRSVRRAYEKALRQTRDRHEAFRELDLLQSRRIARDAQALWGADHPAATSTAAVAGRRL